MYGEDVPFPAMGKEPKDRRGLAPRSASAPVANPRIPLRGTLPGELFLEPGAGGTADCLRFCAAAAGWDISRKPGKLDEESAPVATSRRGWSVIGGRMGTSAPTQGGADNWKKNARLVQATVAVDAFSTREKLKSVCVLWTLRASFYLLFRQKEVAQARGRGQGLEPLS